VLALISRTEPLSDFFKELWVLARALFACDKKEQSIWSGQNWNQIAPFRHFFLSTLPVEVLEFQVYPTTTTDFYVSFGTIDPWARL